MSDDSFIREVNEEIRQEKARALWGRYGPALILFAVFLVLATAVYQGYKYWQDNKGAAIGDQFVAALTLADQQETDKAITALDEVVAKKFGGYPALAQLRKASLLAANNKKAEAVALFDAIAADSSTPDLLKKIAQLRAAYVLVDSGSFDDVEKRVGEMANEADIMRVPAWEALGFSAWKAEKNAEALKYFQQIVEEGPQAGHAMDRAQLMVDLIKSRTPTDKG